MFARNCAKRSDNLFHDQFSNRSISDEAQSLKEDCIRIIKLTFMRHGAMKNAGACNRAGAYNRMFQRNSLQHDGIYQADWPLTRDALCLPSLILWRALSHELIFRNAGTAFRSILNADDWQFFKRSSHLATPALMAVCPAVAKITRHFRRFSFDG